MRAIRLAAPGGLDRLRVDVTGSGPLTAYDVRVRLHASSLNYHDYLVATGLIPVEDGRIPMSDGAGEVVEVGSAESGLAVGDRVVGLFHPRWRSGPQDGWATSRLPGDRSDGFAREEVVAPASSFVRAPAGWSHAEAATLPCAALTAWRALFEVATVRPGELVLVQGTGGVSVFALQLAKTAGATVVATSSTPAKLERLRELGADQVVDYRQEHWGREVRRLTGGVDHVVDVSGNLTEAVSACKVEAHVALVSVLDRTATTFPFLPTIAKAIRFTGLSVGSREHHLAMTRALEASGIRPVVDASFPLERIADAFRHQESGAHVGKIVLEW